jgi:restriction system protein
MARRGFFAELQHQAKVSAREAERAQAARARQHAAAVRSAEQAQRAAERAAAQAQRAAAADRKRLEKEAKEAHVAAMQANVAERNASLETTYEEIDSLLAATLEVDDFVDLEALRRTVEHPPFDKSELETPIPPPPPIVGPPEPHYVEPPPPAGLFGKKKKHAEAIEASTAQHEQAHRAWQAEVASLPARRQAAADEHAKAEQLRVQRLEAERARYAAECTAREAEVAEKNAALDALITNLGTGDRSRRGVHLDCPVELGVPGALPRPPRVHVRSVHRRAVSALPRPRPEPDPHDKGVQVREGRR